MPNVLSFVDVEAAVIAGLAPLGVQVGTAVPNPRPAAFLRVQRTGGTTKSRVIDVSQIVVEAWASDEESAADLIRDARFAMGELAGQTINAAHVKSVRHVSGPSALPDPLSEKTHSRYTTTYELQTRGVSS